MTITDRATGTVAVTRRANGNGVAAFNDVPAGIYAVAVSGPWDLESELDDVLVRSGGCWYTCEFDIRLVPGEPDPTTTSSPTPEPTTTTPAPQGSPPPGDLPNTGADVRWLFGLGVLTVLTGAGLLLIRRKRA
ncbi:LPXTG cell wall anchor domain-containing protein [Actinokineospora soli]|uniref:LPXTG cell wall anchor domain-containing protein n=1 Tax=Actinokineospora soli TaxID=1048753 RepID=A0ABW2TVW0_9PSEU